MHNNSEKESEMKTEFLKQAEQYAECVATDRKGSEFTFTQERLELFVLEMLELAKANDSELFKALNA
jgi:hypothetical protein